jgi:cold shock CspA family protein
MPMMRGFVRRKIKDKNYGFIEGDDQRDYFVYWNDFSRRSIPFRNARDAGPDGADKETADRCEFDFDETDKGPHAKNVFVLRTIPQDEPVVEIPVTESTITH